MSDPEQRASFLRRVQLLEAKPVQLGGEHEGALTLAGNPASR